MGCVTNCALFLVNLIVLMVGIAVIALSSYVIHTTMDYNKLMLDGVLMLPLWTLIGGISLTVLSCFGCCGTLKKSPCMLRTYGSLVLVFFAMELVCGVLLIVFREQAPEYIRDRMMRMFQLYGKEDQALTDSIDLAQHQIQCCGINNYQDWFIILNSNDVTKGCCTNLIGDADTCYKNINELNPVQQLGDTIYTKGCYQAMIDDLGKETLALGILAIILVVIQLLCIIFAFVTASQTSTKTERKRYNSVNPRNY